MQSTRPINCNVAFSSIQTRCTFHTTASANAAELEKAIEHRTIVSNIVFALLFCIVIHVVGRYALQEIYIFIGMELCHFEFAGRFGALD